MLVNTEKKSDWSCEGYKLLKRDMRWVSISGVLSKGAALLKERRDTDTHIHTKSTCPIWKKMRGVCLWQQLEKLWFSPFVWQIYFWQPLTNKENRLKAEQPTSLAAMVFMKKTEFIISQGFPTVMIQGIVTKCLFVGKGPRKPIKTILLRLGPV